MDASVKKHDKPAASGLPGRKIGELGSDSCKSNMEVSGNLELEKNMMVFPDWTWQLLFGKPFSVEILKVEGIPWSISAGL